MTAVASKEALLGSRLERIDVVDAERGFRDTGDHRLEFAVLGDEVGFTVDFHHDAQFAAGVHIGLHDTFRRGPAGPRGTSPP